MTNGEGLKPDLEPRDPDTRLMLQVRDDIPGAFEAIVDRYQHRLLGVLYHLVGDTEAAEDLTQDVFLRVYRARKSYQPRAKFSTWLFTIANNLARNHLRDRGRGPLMPSGVGTRPMGLPSDAMLPGPDGTASAQFRRVELAEIVREALESLGEDQKMAVLLNKFEGMSYAEIAEVMGRSEPAIKSLLVRARFKLREHLEPYLSRGDWPASREQRTGHL